TRAIFLCEDAPLEWFSKQSNLTIFDSARQSNYRQYLGSESANLLIDSREHVNANAIAALIGTLSGGGLAFILLPRKSTWSPFTKRLVAFNNPQVALLAHQSDHTLWQQHLQSTCFEMA